MVIFDKEQPVPPVAAGEAHPAEMALRSTAAALGAAFVAWDRLTSGRSVGRWRDVALGAAFEAEETAAGLVADLRRTAAMRRRWVAELAQRGAVERARGRERRRAVPRPATDEL